MEETRKKSNLMRKNKKRHNEKAKQIVDVIIDTKEQKKIKLDNINTSIIYDECNEYALPSKKRQTKKIQNKTSRPLLSKKRKKKLEKVMELKQKKSERICLLEQLSKVQATPAELKQLTSIQTNQTLGRRKYLSKVNINEDIFKSEISNNQQKINILKGNRKHCRIPENKSNKKIRYNDNYIVETSSSSENNETDTEETSTLNREQDFKTICNINITENKINLQILDVSNSELSNLDETEIVKTKNKTNKILEDQKKDIKLNSTAFKLVKRLPEINEYRSKLPVVLMEYEIMSAIKENSIVIIDGSTGSGKTTQVPQFLFETGFTNCGKIIGITQPRRVAAIEMSKRVAYEMNLSQDEVSYQIRFEGNTTDKTKIKFVTDGVLLKEFISDPLLEKYSAIVIDEAHERSIFSDILIGILSRVIRCRLKIKDPMKLVIMSATMDESSFTLNRKLFSKIPPIIKVDSKMYDVIIHYNKVTYTDYITEAYNKACQIHRKLPPGGILIFVTGKEEVNKLCKKLSRTFPLSKTANKLTAYETKLIANKESKKVDNCIPMLDNFNSGLKLSDFSEENLTTPTVETSGELDNDDDDCLTNVEKIRLATRVGDDFEQNTEQSLYILPMYSMLDSSKLNLVFKDPPEGSRLCVVATNIAETSLTIPNIVYVIDTGKIKGKIYNPTTGVAKMQVMWTSKASADQRKGRAGRVQNGHCYRLYSATVFTDLFQDHAPADILRRPVDDVVLTMKTRNIPVLNFPYITPPPEEELCRSIKLLKMLGALSEPESSNGKDLARITPFGKKMSQLSVSPRYSKMLLESFVYPELVPYFILLVCGLTVQEAVLLSPKGLEDDYRPIKNTTSEDRNSWLGEGTSQYLGEHAILVAGILKAERADNSREFCKENGIRFKAYQEIRKLRGQITNEANLMFSELNVPIIPECDTLTNIQANVMRKIILQGSLDKIAKKIRDCDIKDNTKKKLYANAYRIICSEEPIYLHFSSPFKDELPNWVVYQEIYEINNKKVMIGVSTIDPKWIAELCPEMCTFSDPLPSPRYDATIDSVMCYQNVTYGPLHWIIPRSEYKYPYTRKIYDWFAYFILEGVICPLLKPFADHLYDTKTLISPVALRYSTIRKNFTSSLMKTEAINLKTLTMVWQTHPNYLLSEYLAWLEDDNYKEKIEKLWPPCERNEVWTPA